MKISSRRHGGATIEVSPRPANRLEGRNQRSAGLIRSALAFIAAATFNASVLAITQAADVGMGSSYTYFDTKEQLFPEKPR